MPKYRGIAQMQTADTTTGCISYIEQQQSQGSDATLPMPPQQSRERMSESRPPVPDSAHSTPAGPRASGSPGSLTPVRVVAGRGARPKLAIDESAWA